MIIYKATNLINGKIYIGKTVRSLAWRKQSHLRVAKRKINNMVFHAAIRKYGEENFKWEIVDKCLFAESLLVLEKHYIETFQSKASNGYNLTAGGSGSIDFHHSQATKNKMSKSRLGHTTSTETRHKISLANSGPGNHLFGKHFSPERLLKQKKALKGHTVSPETRAKIAAANTGKRHSIESIEKNRLAHLGKKQSVATRQKRSASMIGHIISIETKEKISVANKLRWAKRRSA